MEEGKRIVKSVVAECAAFFGHLQQFCLKYNEGVILETADTKSTEIKITETKRKKKIAKKENKKKEKKNKIKNKKKTIPMFLSFIKSLKQDPEFKSKFATMSGREISSFCSKMWKKLEPEEKKKYSNMKMPNSKSSSVFEDQSVDHEISSKEEMAENNDYKSEDDYENNEQQSKNSQHKKPETKKAKIEIRKEANN